MLLLSGAAPSGPPGTRTPIAGLRYQRLAVGPAAPVTNPQENRNPKSDYRKPKVFIRISDFDIRIFQGDPGWTRTIAFPDVSRTSSPLDDGTIWWRAWAIGRRHSTEKFSVCLYCRSPPPADCLCPRWESNPQAPGSRPGRYSSSRTRTVPVAVSGVAPDCLAYEARLGAGPTAKHQ